MHRRCRCGIRENDIKRNAISPEFHLGRSVGRAIWCDSRRSQTHSVPPELNRILVSSAALTGTSFQTEMNRIVNVWSVDWAFVIDWRFICIKHHTWCENSVNLLCVMHRHYYYYMFWHTIIIVVTEQRQKTEWKVLQLSTHVRNQCGTCFAPFHWSIELFSPSAASHAHERERKVKNNFPFVALTMIFHCLCDVDASTPHRRIYCTAKPLHNRSVSRSVAVTNYTVIICVTRDIFVRMNEEAASSVAANRNRFPITRIDFILPANCEVGEHIPTHTHTHNRRTIAHVHHHKEFNKF